MPAMLRLLLIACVACAASSWMAAAAAADELMYDQVVLLQGGRGVVTSSLKTQTRVFVGGSVESGVQVTPKRKSGDDAFPGRLFLTMYDEERNVMGPWVVYVESPETDGTVYLYNIAETTDSPLIVGTFSGNSCIMTDATGQKQTLTAQGRALTRETVDYQGQSWQIAPVNFFVIKVDSYSGAIDWATSFTMGWFQDRTAFPLGLSLTSNELFDDDQDLPFAFVFLSTSFVDVIQLSETTSVTVPSTAALEGTSAVIEPIIIEMDGMSGIVKQHRTRFFLLTNDDALDVWNQLHPLTPTPSAIPTAATTTATPSVTESTTAATTMFITEAVATATPSVTESATATMSTTEAVATAMPNATPNPTSETPSGATRRADSFENFADAFVKPSFVNTVITHMEYLTSTDDLGGLVVAGYQRAEDGSVYYNVLAFVEIGAKLGMAGTSICRWQHRHNMGKEPAYPAIALAVDGTDTTIIMTGVFKDSVDFSNPSNGLRSASSKATCHQGDGQCIFAASFLADTGSFLWATVVERTGTFPGNFDRVVPVAVYVDYYVNHKYAVISGPSTNATRISIVDTDIESGTNVLQIDKGWPKSKSFVAIMSLESGEPEYLKEMIQNAEDGSVQMISAVPNADKLTLLVGGYVLGNNLAFDFESPGSASQPTAFFGTLVLKNPQGDGYSGGGGDSETLSSDYETWMLVGIVIVVIVVLPCLCWRFRLHQYLMRIFRPCCGGGRTRYRRLQAQDGNDDDIVFSIEDDHVDELL